LESVAVMSEEDGAGVHGTHLPIRQETVALTSGSQGDKQPL
jgi:hypothetical protein